MKYSQASQGRVFVIRLEDGDILHEEIEAFAKEHDIRCATLTAVGGADKGSTLIVGPEGEGRTEPVTPMSHLLAGVSEVAATGTLFPDEEGTPILHMHAACGRQGQTVTGCVRSGVNVWQVLEVILIELVDCAAGRAFDPQTGFKLLEPNLYHR